MFTFILGHRYRLRSVYSGVSVSEKDQHQTSTSRSDEENKQSNVHITLVHLQLHQTWPRHSRAHPWTQLQTLQCLQWHWHQNPSWQRKIFCGNAGSLSWYIVIKFKKNLKKITKIPTIRFYFWDFFWPSLISWSLIFCWMFRWYNIERGALCCSSRVSVQSQSLWPLSQEDCDTHPMLRVRHCKH